MIEVLLAAVIIVALALLGAISYFRNYRLTALKNTARETVAGFRLAQQLAISQEQGKVWGIHINNTDGVNPYWDVFSDVYAPANITQHYALPNIIGIQTPAAGVSTTIIFAKLTGLPSASTTLVLQNRGSNQTRTIMLNEFGWLDINE